jgi:hypothetical protein
MSALTSNPAAGVAEIVAGYLKAASEIDSLIRGYVDDLTRNFLDVLDGAMSVPAAVRAHQRYIDTLAEQAYDAGMTDGGADPAEKDSADEETFNAWIVEQDSHIEGLWDAVKQLRKEAGDLTTDEYNARQLAINDRIGQWGESLRNLYSLAKANAQRNLSVTWALGATEMHCETCAGLDGQRHRLKWFIDKGLIPQQNGSQTLQCGGWRCDCTLSDDSGNQIMP